MGFSLGKSLQKGEWAMKPGQLLTLLFLVMIAAVAVFDMFALFSESKMETVSENLVTWSKGYPALPLACGFVLGHLFFPMR